MKPSLSEMLASFRTRRERRLIEAAMRAAPRPAPPEGLKERLIEEALAAGRAISPSRRRSAAWMGWGAAAVVAAVAISWVVVGGARHREQMAAAPPQRHKAAASVKTSSTAHAPATPRSPKLRRTALAKHQTPAQAGAVGGSSRIRVKREALPITVTVTRVRQPHIGYARAAAWQTDETGGRIRTQWTLVDDSRAGQSRQELAMIDASGRPMSLMVAVVSRASDGKEPKGEDL